MHKTCDDETKFRPMTFGRRALDEYSKKRKLARLCAEHGAPLDLAVKILTGERTPTAAMIFALRNAIHPIEWFYATDEALPKRGAFKSDMQELCIAKSEGRTRLARLLDKKDFAERKKIMAERGVSEITFLRLLYGDGKVSFSTLFKLRDLVSPELWFC